MNPMKSFLYSICASAMCFVLIYQSSASAQALDEGLAGYWTFDEGGGATALDFSGSGNDGLLMNDPAWAEGKIKYALDFDGDDDYVQINGLSSYQDFTIIGWIKLNDQASTELNDNNLFFEKDSKDNRILIRPNGYYIEFNGNYAQGNTASNVNEWIHIAIARNGSTATFYRNAVFINSWDIGPEPVDFASGVIGGNGKYWFNGLIDEVRIYQHSLSASDISEIYAYEFPDDAIPPYTPENISATATSAYNLKLNWNASIDNVRLAGYKVYRNGTHINSVSTTWYSDSGLDPGTTYSYKVSALDTAGNESESSITVEATTRAINIRDHPRLYLTDEKISFLRSKVSGNVEPYAAFWASIQSKADQYASDTPPPPDDPQVAGPNCSRDIGNRLPYLAMAYQLTGEQKYLDGAKKWADAIASYPTWGGDKDLCASHILFGMSTVYDWLYQDLTEAERETYAAKMKYHADILYYLLVNSDFWWTDNYHQNHNYVNTTVIMAAGIALYDVIDNPDDYIQASYDNFTHVLEALPPDGASTEGVSYWSYGCEALLRYFALEEDFLGVDRILENAWFQNTSRYRLYASVPGFEEVIQIADVPSHRQDWYGPGYILQRLAGKFNDPYSQWLATMVEDARKYPRLDWRNMLFYDETIPEEPPYGFPTFGYFEDLGIYTSRGSWENPDAVFLTFKAGPPMGHHAHEELLLPKGSRHAHTDAGVLLLDAYGQYMIVDNGYSYGWLTADHSTITFDGGIGQLGETENPNGLNIEEIIENGGTADIVYTDFTDDYEYLVANLTKMYKPELQLTKFIRHIIFIKKKIIVVIDELESKITHDIEWRLHINENAIVDLDGRKAIATFPESGTGLVLEDISQNDYPRTIEDYSVSYTDQEVGITTTFNSKLFQIRPHDDTARIETVIRPYKGEAPEDVIMLERSSGYLQIQVDDLLIDISDQRIGVSVLAPGRWSEISMRMAK